MSVMPRRSMSMMPRRPAQGSVGGIGKGKCSGEQTNQNHTQNSFHKILFFGPN
jgi:hypothetical protein